MKGTAHKRMMPSMSTYGGQENAGYKPPKGSAGGEAIGEYSHKSNPRSVPKKGSQIYGTYGAMDSQKVRKLESAQASKESLRGYTS